MTLTELKELRDRVRGLTGPDRDVDAHLCVTFQYMPAYYGVPLNLRRADDQGLGIGSIWLDYEADEDGSVVEYTDTDTAPALTGSTDAALAFSEKVLPGVLFTLIQTLEGWNSGVLVGARDTDGIAEAWDGHGATAAIAIIEATLTALIETME